MTLDVALRERLVLWRGYVTAVHRELVDASHGWSAGTRIWRRRDPLATTAWVKPEAARELGRRYREMVQRLAAAPRE